MSSDKFFRPGLPIGEFPCYGYALLRTMSTSTKNNSKVEVMHDKQSERDHRELRIDKVGVRGLRFPSKSATKKKSCRTPSRPSACSSTCPMSSKART